MRLCGMMMVSGATLPSFWLIVFSYLAWLSARLSHRHPGCFKYAGLVGTILRQ